MAGPPTTLEWLRDIRALQQLSPLTDGLPLWVRMMWRPRLYLPCLGHQWAVQRTPGGGDCLGKVRPN